MRSWSIGETSEVIVPGTGTPGRTGTVRVLYSYSILIVPNSLLYGAMASYHRDGTEVPLLLLLISSSAVLNMAAPFTDGYCIRPLIKIHNLKVGKGLELGIYRRQDEYGPEHHNGMGLAGCGCPRR